MKKFVKRFIDVIVFVIRQIKIAKQTDEKNTDEKK
jgi:hypothetical protein